VSGRVYPKSRGLALSAVFASLLAVSALISIPLGAISPVPITLQVLIVYLIAMILGPSYGALSCLLYLLLGLAGFPVFAGGTSGIQHLVGPTGGYLFSFPLAVFVGGFLSRGSRGSNRSNLICFSIAAGVMLLIIYGIGMAWLSVEYLNGNLYEGFISGVVPFIAFDILKAVIAVPIAFRVRRAGLYLPTKSIIPIEKT